MKQPHCEETEHTLLEEGARELGGYDDSSLQREAADEMRIQEAAGPDGAEGRELSEEELDARFELLKARIRAERIRPVSERRYERQQKRNLCLLCSGKRICRKMMALAVAAAVLAFGGGIAATARSGYRRSVYPSPDKRSVKYIYNTVSKAPDGGLEQAYVKIKKNLRIPVMEFAYLPGGLTVSEVVAEDGFAMVHLKGEGRNLVVRMVAVPAGDFADSSIADRATYENVFNEWLDREILIEKNELAGGRAEYSAWLEGDDGYYSLEGKMEENEFFQVVKNVNFAL